MAVMTAEQKANWIKELRSGTVRQTTEVYCRGDTQIGIDHRVSDVPAADRRANYCFCVIGVLCYLCNGHLGQLSNEEFSKLTSMNDEGTPFDKLADWIEANIVAEEQVEDV